MNKRLMIFIGLALVVTWIVTERFSGGWILEPYPLFKIPFTGHDYFWISAKIDFTTLNHFLIALVMAIFFRLDWVIIYHATYEIIGKGIGFASCVGVGKCLQGMNVIDLGAMAAGIALGHLAQVLLIWYLPPKLFRRWYFLFERR